MVTSIKVKGSGFLEVRIRTTYGVFIAKIYHFVSPYSCATFPEFRGGKSPILIATDVASRGLGIVCSHLSID